MDLETLRKRIDAIDLEIVERLNARVKLALQVGQLKRKEGMPARVPGREKVIFKRLAAVSHGDLKLKTLRAIYKTILTDSVALQIKVIKSTTSKQRVPNVKTVIYNQIYSKPNRKGRAMQFQD